ncbi:MAG: hypothetical protein ACLP5V_07930 [Candidatus Bathyarchaeia archaeon]
MLLEKIVFVSRYEFSVLYGVLLMAPVAGQPIVQWPTALRTTTIADYVDFGLTNRHEFSNWISFFPVLGEFAISQRVFSMAEVALESRDVCVPTPLRRLDTANQNQFLLATMLALCGLVLEYHSAIRPPANSAAR